VRNYFVVLLNGDTGSVEGSLMFDHDPRAQAREA
jgi:hypothetical protein